VSAPGVHRRARSGGSHSRSTPQAGVAYPGRGGGRAAQGHPPKSCCWGAQADAGGPARPGCVLWAGGVSRSRGLWGTARRRCHVGRGRPGGLHLVPIRQVHQHLECDPQTAQGHCNSKKPQPRFASLSLSRAAEDMEQWQGAAGAQSLKGFI